MTDPHAVAAKAIVYPARVMANTWWIGLLVGNIVCRYGTAYKDSIDAYAACVSLIGVKPEVMPKGAVVT